MKKNLFLMDPTQNMTRLRFTSRQFLVAGEVFARKFNKTKKGSKQDGRGTVEDRRFRSTFGVDAIVCAIAWEWMVWKVYIPKGGTKEHLLWVCFQLMVYPTEDVISLLIDVDAKTFRYRSFQFLLALRDLAFEVVSGDNFTNYKNVYITIKIVFCMTLQINWDDRHVGDGGNNCLVSVDCTDCRL